jgi:aminoglycoside phosphotransferase (APT) family kinase protein
MLAQHWKTLSSATQERVLDQLVEFMLEVHAVATDQAVERGIPTGPKWWPSPDGLRASLALERNAPWREMGLDYADRYERHLRNTEPPRLLHHDLHWNNVLFDPGSESVVGVIDFGDVIVSDVHRDFFPFSWFGSDLSGRAAAVYERRTGSALDRQRIEDLYVLAHLADLHYDMTLSPFVKAGLDRFASRFESDRRRG